MTHDECMKSDSKEAKRVRKILKEIKEVNFPDDLIMYQILKGFKKESKHNTCKECKLFDIEAAKDKAGRVRKANAVKCLWQSKEVYPYSISCLATRPKVGHVTSDSGHGCRCFQKRDT